MSDYAENFEKAMNELTQVKSDLIWALHVIMDEYPATDNLFKRATDLMRKHVDHDFVHWSER